jgi:L-alanine-DL-glutamate epimerase-like enolase superfamily enzyme
MIEIDLRGRDLKVDVKSHRWAYRSVFRIAYRVEETLDTVVVELDDGVHRGRGEGIGVPYKQETNTEILTQIEQVRHALEAGLSRIDLQTLLPACAARNAIDCALWDLEAKSSGQRVWDLLGHGGLRPVTTDLTIGVDTPTTMANKAAEAKDIAQFKLKMGDADDLERIVAVRAARPDAALIVDANQSWSFERLATLLPHLARLNVLLIEQPLPAGKDQALQGFVSPVPLCADESCQTRASLPQLLGKYSHVNIKLDKTGGLTEALALVEEARAAGFGLMVGCMGGTSLSMAPALLIAQHCEFVDLDGPLLITEDVPNALQYHAGRISMPEPALWG